MANGNEFPLSRVVIWLPDCQSTEAEAFEQFCRNTVMGLNGQVVATLHNNPQRLLAVLQAGEVDTIIYPKHGSLVRDSLLAGIVHGVLLGLFGVTLYCAGERTFLAVPQAFVHLVQDAMTTHLQTFYAQSLPLVSGAVPMGYRRVGDTVQVDPVQAEQVREVFSSKATER